MKRFQLLLESAKIATRVMEDLAASLALEMSEAAAASLAPDFFARYGAEQIQPPLILFGPRTATAMAEPLDEVRLTEGSLILLDIVGGVSGVGADFTRMFTWGKPKSSLLSAFARLLRIHEETLASIAVGVSLRDLFNKAVSSLHREFGVPYPFDRIGHGIDGLDGTKAGNSTFEKTVILTRVGGPIIYSRLLPPLPRLRAS